MQLTEQQTEKFEQDGYLFFPNAFSTEEILAVLCLAGAVMIFPCRAPER